MSIDQFGIHIGQFYFRFYAMSLLAGIIAAAFLIAYRAKQRGEDPDHVWNGLIWVVLAVIPTTSGVNSRTALARGVSSTSPSNTRTWWPRCSLTAAR